MLEEIKDVTQDVIITIILFSLMEIKYQIHKDEKFILLFFDNFVVDSAFITILYETFYITMNNILFDKQIKYIST